MKKYLLILMTVFVSSLAVQPELNSMGAVRALWSGVRVSTSAACTTGKFTYDVAVIGKDALAIFQKGAFAAIRFECANIALLPRFLALMTQHKNNEDICPLAEFGLVGWQAIKIALWAVGNILIHTEVVRMVSNYFSVPGFVALLIVAAILKSKVEKEFDSSLASLKQRVSQIASIFERLWNCVVLENPGVDKDAIEAYGSGAYTPEQQLGRMETPGCLPSPKPQDSIVVKYDAY
jgi:hypothetical protein